MKLYINLFASIETNTIISAEKIVDHDAKDKSSLSEENLLVQFFFILHFFTKAHGFKVQLKGKSRTSAIHCLLDWNEGRKGGRKKILLGDINVRSVGIRFGSFFRIFRLRPRLNLPVWLALTADIEKKNENGKRKWNGVEKKIAARDGMRKRTTYLTII